MYVETESVAQTGNRTEDTPVRTRSLPGWIGLPLAAPSSAYVRLKRGADVVLALALLVLSAPLVLLAAVLVKLTSRGPAFYSQTRVGRGGTPFTIYKVRTMHQDCERHSGVAWCKPGDPRVFPVGKFLRRTHLDELPQLWNVLRGDMSLIGPRPERPEFVPQLEQAIPRYRERLLVLPGVTGLAQVHLPPDTDMASVRRKLAFDLYYIKTFGALSDARIFVCTIFHVFAPLVLSKWLYPLSERDCLEAIGEPAVLQPSAPSKGA